VTALYFGSAIRQRGSALSVLRWRQVCRGMCCRPPQARCCAAMSTGMEVGTGCRESFGYIQHHLVCEQVTACHSMINSLRCAALSVQIVHTLSLCTHSVSVRTMQDLPRSLLNNGEPQSENEVSLAGLLVSQGNGKSQKLRHLRDLARSCWRTKFPQWLLNFASRT